MEPKKRLKVEGKNFDLEKDQISGKQIKELAGLDPGKPLVLIIKEQEEVEHVGDEDIIDIHIDIEEVVVREKHEHNIILTIETTKGDWNKASFHKHLTVDHLIKKIVKKFGFAPDGKYALKVKGRDDLLDPTKTLESYHLEDCTILIFTDIGGGA
jgi:hypothetical protein